MKVNRYRLLVYTGDAEWIENTLAHNAMGEGHNVIGTNAAINSITFKDFEELQSTIEHLAPLAAAGFTLEELKEVADDDE